MDMASKFFGDTFDWSSESKYPTVLSNDIAAVTTSAPYGMIPASVESLQRPLNASTYMPSPRSSVGESPLLTFQDDPYSFCDPNILERSGETMKQSVSEEPLTPVSNGTGGTARLSTRSSTNSVPTLDTAPMETRQKSRTQTASRPKMTSNKPTKAIKLEEDDEEGIETNDQNDEKRKKFLEKNRIAASKCREKKKKWMSNLENEAQDLEDAHKRLRLERSKLSSEVTELKSALMSHASCNDPNINAWLDSEARRVASKTLSGAVFATPNLAPQRNDSIVSSSGYPPPENPTYGLASQQGSSYAQSPSPTVSHKDADMLVMSSPSVKGEESLIDYAGLQSGFMG